MAIETTCDHCNKTFRLKDTCAGLRGQCPFCKGTILVPTPDSPKESSPPSVVLNEEKEFVEPTEKQLDYAGKLGIQIPEGISRRQLSAMIDDHKDNMPASQKQIEFLQELGVTIPPNLRVNQASLLLDAALNLRDQIAEGVIKQYEEQMKQTGQFMEDTTVEQLLEALDEKGKPFIAIVLEDDEFRYQENRPMKGRMVWNWILNKEDVQYLITNFAFEWAKDFDINAYSDEFDGGPPDLEFSVGELGDD
jgi:hypothetical protein